MRASSAFSRQKARILINEIRTTKEEVAAFGNENKHEGGIVDVYMHMHVQRGANSSILIISERTHLREMVTWKFRIKCLHRHPCL